MLVHNSPSLLEKDLGVIKEVGTVRFSFYPKEIGLAEL